MTHPYPVPGLLPIGIRSMGVRLLPGRLFDDRKGGSRNASNQSSSSTPAATCLPGRQKGIREKHQSDPADEFGGGTHADLIRRTQPRSITCKETNK
jgi:hypothetical protein